MLWDDMHAKTVHRIKSCKPIFCGREVHCGLLHTKVTTLTQEVSSLQMDSDLVNI